MGVIGRLTKGETLERTLCARLVLRRLAASPVVNADIDVLIRDVLDSKSRVILSISVEVR